MPIIVTNSADDPPPLEFHLLMGPQFPIEAKNAYTNLKAGKITLIELVCKKPSAQALNVNPKEIPDDN